MSYLYLHSNFKIRINLTENYHNHGRPFRDRYHALRPMGIGSFGARHVARESAGRMDRDADQGHLDVQLVPWQQASDARRCPRVPGRRSTEEKGVSGFPNGSGSMCVDRCHSVGCF